ncbi:MAG TPA: polymer-forming cytoskeletal protein [Anaerolineales bacterium]|nr:polymer-forming cytoskeletal protein [Anaerolineales bacterium]
MKKTLKLFTLIILLALMLVPTRLAYAQGPNPGGGGQVIFGSNYTVESGDTFEGDLVVFGGNVTIEEDASLNGNLVVIGGTIKSNGETQGDVVVVGGQISLEESALVAGDVVTVGGQLEQAEGAKIEGEVVNNVAPNIVFPSGRIPPTLPDTPNVPDVPRPNINISYNPFAEVFWIFFWAVVVAGFSMLLSLFWQPQIERTASAVVTQPLMTGAIGLLSFFVAAILFLTVIPPILVAFAWLFGVVAMGSEVGERFTKAINQVWSPVLTIGFGTFLLMLVGGAIGLIPCLGGLVLFLLGMLGIGGSMITWFGARPQVPAMTVYTPPTPPPAS